MAFSYTVRGTRYGGVGDVQIYGDWSGNSGDAAGSITVYGPVAGAVFQKFDALDNTYEIIPRIETSVSSGITTITVENQDDVTNGKFVISKLSQ